MLDSQWYGPKEAHTEAITQSKLSCTSNHCVSQSLSCLPDQLDPSEESTKAYVLTHTHLQLLRVAECNISRVQHELLKVNSRDLDRTALRISAIVSFLFYKEINRNACSL